MGVNLTQSRILISGNSRSGTTSFASQFMQDHRYFSEITRRDIPRRFAELSHDGPITVSDIENRLNLVCSTKRSLCKFLISDNASWITGQIIGVDGGRGSIASI